MTAVVSREQARKTCLTAAAGVLMLAVAFVMMVAAAPAHGGARARGTGVDGTGAHGTGRPSAVRLATDVCHQLTPRSDSATARACRAGPSLVSARADAYVPSMTSDNRSAGGAGRVVRPPLARTAVS
jgi:hypothetical protein